MVFKRGEQIAETTQQVRPAERGPTVRNVLVAHGPRNRGVRDHLDHILPVVTTG
jgi:hypothetical protein